MTEPRNQSSANNREQGNSNDDAICYGNRHGRISFGQIHKPGDVTSAFCVETADGRHNLFMDADGPRKGWTTSISPGHLQMQCGRDSTKEEDSCVIYADNGNIVINAGNGNMRFIANNFEFTAQGEDGTEGNFKVEASQSIILDAKKIQCTAKNFLKLATPGKMEICANENLKLYGGVIRGITNAVSKKDSKLGGKDFWKEQQP